MARKLPRKVVKRARELRDERTDAEGLLWWKLKEANRHGWHFRQQVPFRGYYLDFAEHSAKLAIELDGGQHGTNEQAAYDAVRDDIVTMEGYQVLRFTNCEVFKRLGDVVEIILREAKARRPHPKNREAIFRPPHKGEVIR